MGRSEQELKWFGEGFDGFPKCLPDDCIEYTIYIINPKLSDFERREQLRKVRDAGIKLTQKLTKGFIWQREPLTLALERFDGHDVLKGCTNFGDSVEDEWLIVYILRELSQRHPQIWLRIVDSDGQFLLIEAAGVLPKWLNPEIADFRVWLNSGRLYLIPVDNGPAVASSLQPKSSNLNLQEALIFIENEQSKLKHSPTVQAEAFGRLRNYPEQISISLHYAMTIIPRKLAYVLHENPSYISPTIEAFYLRDPIAMRPLRSLDRASLRLPPEDLVTVSVKFTRVGYAQLKGQHFEPSALWTGMLSSQSILQRRAAAELGVKVTSGFEMLISDPQNQDKQAVREINMLLEDVEADQSILPSDSDIEQWDKREDDESWLDINFEDFEKELNGESTPGSTGPATGFGDKGAQENLRKMVARFGDFLDDDAAGADGAEGLDDMDEDDDDDDSTLSDDSEELGADKDIDFDESKFAKMMREMMGLPSDQNLTSSHELASIDVSKSESNEGPVFKDIDDEGLQQTMHAIEHELREAGALELNHSQGNEPTKPYQKGTTLQSSSKVQSSSSTEAEADDDHRPIDIDYDLAKNMLGSLKSQGGASRPSSNLLGLMGLQMPRDEDGQV